MSSRQRGVVEHARVRRVVLCLVATCYLAAFVSLFADYRGLFGAGGILPAKSLLNRAADATVRITGGRSTLLDRLRTFPTLLWLHKVFGVTVDTLAESILLLGSVLSATAAFLAVLAPAGGVALVWVALFGCYLSLFAVGQTFLSFQWDILLLETGFLCVFLCPTARPCSKSPPPPHAIWLLRLLAFKLMLMSGAVKIQSGCPTWHQLTALDYHWATQPLPTPLAWFARRYTSSAVRKLGVALTLALEGPGTLLLIAPFRACRHVGATAQIVLQVAIAATGNYTFFNLLTVALMVACYDDAGLPRLLAPGPAKRKPRAAAARTAAARTAAAAAATPTAANDATTSISTPVTPVTTAIANDEDSSVDSDDDDSSDSTASPVLGVVSTPAMGLDDLPADPGERRRVIAAMTTTPRAGRGPNSTTPRTRGGTTPSHLRRTRRRRGLTLVELLVDFSSSRITRRVARVVSFALGSIFTAAVLANCAVMFRVVREEGKPLPSLALGVTIEDTNRWLAVIVPVAVAYVWAVALPFATLAACASDVARSRSALVAVFRVAKSIAFLAAGILMVGVTARPMGSLFADSPGTGSGGAVAFASALPPSTPFDAALAQFVAKTHVSNGYGLFRHMTGVGENGDAARPEITLEASYDEEGSNWTPLVFKYKPGAADVAPKFVAPHQPRLDWQMWFAALGRYNENAWFVALVDRLLRGTPEVWALLAEEFDVQATPPKFVRAARRAYDFAAVGATAGAWWTVSEEAEEYLPALSLDNESVQAFLGAHGLAIDEGGEDEAPDPMSKFVRGVRERSMTAVASAATIFGFAMAVAAIAVDAGAGTVFRSFAAEELMSGSASDDARRTRLSHRRGKLKVQ